MKRAIGVARVSTDEQAADGKVSIDTQLEAIRTWCASNGYEVVEEIREEGVSVTKDLDPDASPRPFWSAYSQLLDAETDAIVFLSRDRLSRTTDPLKVPLLLAEAAKHSDGILFVREPRIAEDPDIAGLVDYMHAISAKQDAQRRTEATTRAQAARFAAGEWATGIPPFGYRRDAATRRLKVANTEADVVRLVFHYYVNEGLSINAIARRLNADGVASPRTVRSKTGKVAAWAQSKLRDILKFEPYATGRCERRLLGATYEVEIPTVVEPDVFRRAQIVREARPRVVREGEKRSTQAGMRTGTRGLLQGLLECGHCGGRLQCNSSYVRGSRRRGQTPLVEHRYHCPNYQHDGSGCPLQPVLGSGLDRPVWEALLGVVRDGGTLREAALAHVDRLAARITELSPEVRRAQRSIEELDSEIGRRIEIEAKYGRSQEGAIARLETEKTEPLRVLQENAGLIRRRAVLERERDLVMGNIEQWAGAIRIEDLAVLDEELAASEEDHSVDYGPFDPSGAVRVWFRGTGDRDGLPLARHGVHNDTSRLAFVDLLQTKVTLWNDRARVEGMVQADLDLGAARYAVGGATVLCRASPSARSWSRAT